MSSPFKQDDTKKHELEIKKLIQDTTPKTNWYSISANLISFGLFVLASIQFYYSRIDADELKERVNTIESQMQELEKKFQTKGRIKSLKN